MWFYRDTLGMRFLFQVPRMAFFEVGGVRLLVGLPDVSDELELGASIIYYHVEDIRAAHDALVERGVRFAQPPHFVAKLERLDLWLAFFRDSEGNVLALMSEVPRK